MLEWLLRLLFLLLHLNAPVYLTREAQDFPVRLLWRFNWTFFCTFAVISNLACHWSRMLHALMKALFVMLLLLVFHALQRVSEWASSTLATLLVDRHGGIVVAFYLLFFPNNFQLLHHLLPPHLLFVSLRLLCDRHLCTLLFALNELPYRQFDNLLQVQTIFVALELGDFLFVDVAAFQAEGLFNFAQMPLNYIAADFTWATLVGLALWWTQHRQWLTVSIHGGLKVVAMVRKDVEGPIALTALWVFNRPVLPAFVTGWLDGAYVPLATYPR